MKKLFFMATLLLAGVMSAKEGEPNVKVEPNIKCMKDNSEKISIGVPIIENLERTTLFADLSFLVPAKAACSNWITVNSYCGVQYYLCSDNYGNMDQLLDAIDYFNNAKCN